MKKIKKKIPMSEEHLGKVGILLDISIVITNFDSPIFYLSVVCLRTSEVPAIKEQ